MEYASKSIKPLTVKEFLDKYGHSALSVRASDSLVDAAEYFSKSPAGRKYSMAVVVDDHEHVVGVLSLGDIVFAAQRHREKFFNMKVGAVMTAQVHALKQSDDIVAALDRMAELDIRHMPVIEDGKCVGLVTRKDALEGLYDDATLELESLTQYVFRSGARY